MGDNRGPFVNQFRDRALSEHFRVAEAGVRQVDLVILAHDPVNAHNLLRETFLNSCDRISSAGPLLARIEDFMLSHNKKVMLPGDIDAAQMALDELLKDIDDWMQQAILVKDFTLSLSQMAPPQRASALDSVALEQLKYFLHEREGDRTRPLMNQVEAHVSKPKDILKQAALVDALMGRWSKGAPGTNAALALKTGYIPKI
jgi:hypothetical protein